MNQILLGIALAVLALGLLLVAASYAHQAQQPRQEDRSEEEREGE